MFSPCRQLLNSEFLTLLIGAGAIDPCSNDRDRDLRSTPAGVTGEGGFFHYNTSTISSQRLGGLVKFISWMTRSFIRPGLCPFSTW